MTKEKARVFSAEEKTRIVLEVLKEESPLSVIASKYEINSKTIRIGRNNLYQMQHWLLNQQNW